MDRWVDMVLGIEMNSSSDWIVAMLVLLLTILFGTPMHVLSGYLVGLEVTRQTHFMKVALYTFLVRSLFMLNIFLWTAIFGAVKPIVAGEPAAKDPDDLWPDLLIDWHAYMQTCKEMVLGDCRFLPLPRP